jgi:hypothetical protein
MTAKRHNTLDDIKLLVDTFIPKIQKTTGLFLMKKYGASVVEHLKKCTAFM